MRCECYFSGPVASFLPNCCCCGFECATETLLSISSFTASVRTLGFCVSATMVYSDYVKQRILFYCCLGKSYSDIADCLSEEGHKASKMGVYKFFKLYQKTGTILRRPGVAKLKLLCFVTDEDLRSRNVLH